MKVLRSKKEFNSLIILSIVTHKILMAETIIDEFYIIFIAYKTVDIDSSYIFLIR
jgi:hypothetical protein